jgi:hypothetical protein
LEGGALDGGALDGGALDGGALDGGDHGREQVLRQFETKRRGQRTVRKRLP